jgi:hypothetical protein
MTEALWKLLQEEPSALSCDECFAVMEYYAELLAQSGEALLPEIIKHLEGCPSCRTEHRAALKQLVRTQEGEAHAPTLKDEAVEYGR